LQPPSEKELPFNLRMVCLSYTEIIAVWDKVRQGVPQEIAWRAIGHYADYEVILTLVRNHHECDDTKMYHYLDRFYYQCLSQVSMALYQKAISIEMNSTNAAKLLLEYNELLLARNKDKIVL
jgi:hypothetical protein